MTSRETGCCSPTAGRAMCRWPIPPVLSPSCPKTTIWACGVLAPPSCSLSQPALPLSSACLPSPGRGRLGAGGGGRRDHRVQARIDRGTQRNVPLLIGSGPPGLPAILQRRRHPSQCADSRSSPPNPGVDVAVDGFRGPGGLIPASARGFSPPINSLSPPERRRVCALPLPHRAFLQK